MEDRVANWFVRHEERQNWRLKGSCYPCSLENGELHCPPTEPVTNTRASGPVASSFEKADDCKGSCLDKCAHAASMVISSCLCSPFFSLGVGFARAEHRYGGMGRRVRLGCIM